MRQMLRAIHMTEARILCDYQNRCGEGPLWDAERQRLLWVDSEGADMYAYEPGQDRAAIISQDLPASSLVLDRQGPVLLGKGVWFWDERGPKTPLVASHTEHPLVFNDSIAGPDGCIYAGTCYWDESGMRQPGRLYRIQPDGVTVDTENFLWCALWYEGTIVRFDPDGKIERRIMLPVKQVSSVAFGGPDLQDLFLTSAGLLFDSGLLPRRFAHGTALGGPLFCIRTDVVGRIENRVSFSCPRADRSSP
jgi:sugar lactone lactonase YvrE